MSSSGLPRFVLPSGLAGWVVAGAAALVGMIAGGIAIIVLGRVFGGGR